MLWDGISSLFDVVGEHEQLGAQGVRNTHTTYVQVQACLTCETAVLCVGVTPQRISSGFCLLEQHEAVSSFCGGARQHAASCLYPGRQSELCVCFKPRHLSCHYPVTVLIKWLARRREAFIKMPVTSLSTHTQEAFPFMSDTFSCH